MKSGTGFCSNSATASAATIGTTLMTAASAAITTALAAPVTGISSAATWVNSLLINHFTLKSSINLYL